MTTRPIDSVLLVGGLSRRFGRTKATADWKGRSLAERVLAARPERPGRTVLVLRAEGDPVPVATDVVTWDHPEHPPGPLRGVIAGLKACTADLAWVTACDLPGLKPSILQLLIDEYRDGDDAVVPVWGDREQPLCALYAASAVDNLVASLTSGERSLIGALKRMNVRRLPEDLLRTVDPAGASFVNVNRPEDLSTLDEQETRP